MKLVDRPIIGLVTLVFLTPASGKSKGNSDGVLITHSKHFKFHANNTNKKNTLAWYVCAENKTTGCPAHATIRTTTVVNDDGEETVTKELVSVSSSQVSIYKY